MLLTVATTHEPATDLGYLLVKHPDRVHEFELPHGGAYVFFPEATPQRCTAALVVEIDPSRLGRTGRDPDGFTLGRFVNDRPYAASSLLATALNRAFRSAMRGESRERRELAAAAIPLTVRIPALRCRGGAGLATRLLEPLGWRVQATTVPLDPTRPEWGDSPYVDVTLTGTLRLADALNQLYVLLPVFDDAKHYWVSPAEVDKLIRAGGGWLAGHPERQRDRVSLLQSAHTYADDRLVGFDAAVLMEVIEHIDPPRLPALAAAVFGHARPSTVVVTTPNMEYNVHYGLSGAETVRPRMRHHDHRFEWTRAELSAWCEQVALRYGYDVRITGVGEADP